MSRQLLILIGLLLVCHGFACAVSEIAVIYNGESELPKNITLGSWGYMPQEIRVINESTGQDVTVDNTAYLYPGMMVNIDGDTVCRVEQVNRKASSVHLSTAVTVEPGSFITLQSPFNPVRLQPNRKIYGLSMLTLGRYQGVYFDIADPIAIDATTVFAEKNNYLELYLCAADEDTGQTMMQQPRPNINTPAPGAAPSPTPPGPLAGAMPSGAGTPSAPVRPPTGAEGFPPDLLAKINQKQPMVSLPSLKNLRFTFFTQKGQGLLTIKQEDFYPKDEINHADVPTWVRIGIPLSALNATLPVGGKLNRVLITSDEPTHFLLGRLAFVHDDDPIKVNLFVYPMFLEAKKRVFFAARVEPGLARFQTTWCFNSKNGDTIDAMGDRVTYSFDKEGTYTVACSVRDMTGAKLTVTRFIDLRVARPQGE